jgi:methyl-accepting chemotaxis protein
MSFSRIRTKLLALVVGVMLLMGAALAAYLVIIAPISRIKAEREVLSSASFAMQGLYLEAGRLLTQAPRYEVPAVEAALQRYHDAFGVIASLKAIPALDADLADAIKIILNVGQMVDSSFASLKESYDGIVATSGVDDSPPLDFSVLLGGDRRKSADLILSLMVLNQKTSDLGNTVGLGTQSLSTQIEIVDGKIRAIEGSALLIGLLAAGAIVLGTLILALIVSRGISKSVEGLDDAVARLKTGDLSVRFAARSRDELGRLAESLNSFLEMLGGFHGRIREAAASNGRMRVELQRSVGTTMSSSEEIEANARSIARQMEGMDGLSATSKRSVDEMGEGFALLLASVETETRLVSDSAAAVTQMLASIGNIARIADADKASSDALVAEAERGREVFEESFERVAGITESVDAIQDMAAVIKGVAEQTNLLAMNAAIEAAHAGDFGKGFAVVADEIRKLSETANASSQDISRTIAGVTRRIHEAADTKDATSAAFDAISTRIVEVSRSITEIYSNVAEMQLGGRQILEAMTDLKTRSTDLASRSRSFNATTAALKEGMESLSRLSSEVVTNIEEITGGMAYIGESVRGIAGETERAEEVGQRLDEEIGLFKTGETAEDGASAEARPA